MEHTAARTPQPRARLTGIVYLLYFLVASAGWILMKGLVVSGDVATTANNIVAHETAYRAGLAFDLLGNALYISLTVLLYSMLRRVDRSVALFAALVSLAGCTVQISSGVFRLVPLLVLGPDHALGAFTPEQLQAIALMALKLHSQAFTVSFVLFAMFDFAIGWLIYRSSFLPRFIGAWFMIGGLCALTFLWPPLATALTYVVIPIAALAELALLLWLLVRGVDGERWHALARGDEHH
jgi:hypothetical protein